MRSWSRLLVLRVSLRSWRRCFPLLLQSRSMFERMKNQNREEEKEFSRLDSARLRYSGTSSVPGRGQEPHRSSLQWRGSAVQRGVMNTRTRMRFSRAEAPRDAPQLANTGSCNGRQTRHCNKRMTGRRRVQPRQAGDSVERMDGQRISPHQSSPFGSFSPPAQHRQKLHHAWACSTLPRSERGITFSPTCGSSESPLRLLRHWLPAAQK